MSVYRFDNIKDSFEEERKRLNLQLLRRHDDSINEIIAHSSFVSVYVMDPNSQKWIRGDVEGFLHIVKRKIEPKYQLIVLNQKNPENLILGISGEWEISAETHFLFYKITNNNNSVVSCLWFYDVEERKFIETELRRIISNFTEKSIDNGNNSKYLQKMSTSSIFKPEQEIFYNDDARKTILGFLNKNVQINNDNVLNDTINSKTTNSEKSQVENNTENVEKSKKTNKNKNINTNSSSGKNTMQKINNSKDNNGDGESDINNCGNEIPSDPLKRLLHFQGILGKKGDSDTKKVTSKKEKKIISSKEIADVVMDVISSKEVYDMICKRISNLMNS
ncbi:hypothetical protein FG386_001178 [Cryptosporidium ryanae]|uniref:uncharacterized protein n=1 Tax=Cryptosporidium ryanae TaxID=515981 RepID=UPI00351A1AA1|nr:hypothetical protein FG386_001178 [Cryptosporidium ryanae]